jgi:NTP pyrophosphatase (non-canonical NTP hydrolase)
MLIREYAASAAAFDQSKNRSPDERRDIALYGLAGEVGSLAAAIKKKLLAAGRRSWNVPDRHIEEELGDSLWYVFALAQATGEGVEFVVGDVRMLLEEVSGQGDRSKLVRNELGPRAEQFVSEAPGFIVMWDAGIATLDDYQRLAYLTRRTGDHQLVEVCLVVLQQLLAELFRPGLPAIEKQLNTRLADRPAGALLGETLWHLAALASLYGLSLEDVACANLAKLDGRFGRGQSTPLHDELRPQPERLPRRFQVAFVPIGPRRSRMYLNGRTRLGDDLTDNSYSEDGYRFHDAMHLAFAAKLGWSPVLRRLMGRKRRSDERLDEVEDGARAAIVEEAVIKIIHAEGVRREALGSGRNLGSQPLFSAGGDISFALLRSLGDLVDGLEVATNRQWEWEDAILCGFELFHTLKARGRGTVSIDLDARSLMFKPDVHLRISGSVAAIGQALVAIDAPNLEDFSDREVELSREHGAASVSARRLAMANAIGLPADAAYQLNLRGWEGDAIAIHPSGSALDAMWRHGVIAFRVTCEEGHAFAVGIADA